MDFHYSEEELEIKNRVRRFAREKLLPIADREWGALGIAMDCLRQL